jgi:L-seryl-tRNA(Ser) seleniumtransferase
VLSDLAEGALAVNNNAAAVFLCLNTLAEGREVVVSRGQLVEVGGSFRIPDVMRKSGALLREVGTTNKTRAADYRDAIGPMTALLLRVHTSNFRVVGFTESVEFAELVAIGRAAGVPVLDDLGSGSLVDLTPFGLPGEPTVQQTVAAGADLVTFSGDKLLGAPQAGLIVGRLSLVERVRKNPLHRAMRIDKLTLAGLEATLRLYLDGEHGRSRVPVVRMLAEPLAATRRRARRLLRRLAPATRARCAAAVVASTCQAGGGALPLEPLASAALALGAPELPAHRLEEALRRGAPPVVGRVHEGRLLLDLRTVGDEEVATLAAAVDAAAAAPPERS